MSITNVDQALTQLQNQTAQVNFQNSRQNVGSGKMNQQAFLRLLMTQLSQQDPMEPVDNAQFISQQAQFTQIEKTDELIKTMSQANALTQGAAVVGKTVELKTDKGSITGMVDSVNFNNGEASINVNGVAHPMGNITKILSGA